jgi:hypothetical protein
MNQFQQEGKPLQSCIEEDFCHWPECEAHLDFWKAARRMILCPVFFLSLTERFSFCFRV